jgi:endonuclease YncB( thermonuclease family)
MAEIATTTGTPATRDAVCDGIRVAVVTIAVLAVVVYAAPLRVSADSVATTALVLKVVDGDTIDIRDDSRGRLRMRLLGIDTPETKKSGFTVGCWVRRRRRSPSRTWWINASRS